MAYTDANWTCVSSALNQGQETVVPFGGVSTVLNAPNLYVYKSPNDTVAQILASNYFLAKYASLCVGDMIMGAGTDAYFAIAITAVSATTVTAVSMGLTTSIGTANIQNLAVTTAKLDNNAVTSAKLSPLVIQYAVVPVSSAEFLGMYAAPKLLVAAGGANTIVVLKQAQLLETYNSAAYAAGGTVAIQWDATINGGGVIASTTLANTLFQGTVSAGFNMNPGVVTETFSTVVNKGLYLSNITAAYTTGNSAFAAHIWYSVIPTV